MMIYKGQSVGHSWVSQTEPILQSRQVFFEFPVLPAESVRQGYIAVLVSKISRIQDGELASEEEDVPNNIHVVDYRLAHVLHLLPFVFAIGIRQKRNALKAIATGNNIDQLPFWVAPNGMEFCLDEHTGSLPDCPAQHALPAELRDALFNNSKALAFWPVRSWLAANVERVLALDQAATKFFDVGGADICGKNHLSSVSELEQ